LTSDQKARLDILIEKKAQAFQLSENDVELTDLIEHEIVQAIISLLNSDNIESQQRFQVKMINK